MKINFEKALQELQKSVQSLESGDLSLEDSLKEFEKGVKLVRSCQTELKKAEKKIEILTGISSKNEPEIENFEEDGEES